MWNIRSQTTRTPPVVAVNELSLRPRGRAGVETGADHRPRRQPAGAWSPDPASRPRRRKPPRPAGDKTDFRLLALIGSHTMLQTVQCPHCGRKLAVDSQHVGTAVVCPMCKESFT